MATTDEIIGDVLGAAELPAGSIPLHVIVIIEYANPGSDNAPGRARLCTLSDENLPPWTSIGMLRFAEQLELDDVADCRDSDTDE